MARPVPSPRGRAGRAAALACAAAAALALAGGGRGFAAPAGAAAPGGGPTRKQMKSNLHTRANLPPVLEVPLDAPEPEPEAKEPLPDRRVPYTMHIISSFPNNKHLHEESSARKFIEEKIINSFENMEDLIKHVEVNLQVSEGFHKDKREKTHTKKQVVEDEDGEVTYQEPRQGTKFLAPYIFKVTITLRTRRTIVFANAEKHAQPTLTEGVDHMVDVLRKSLREEKDKMIEARKKEKKTDDAMPTVVDEMKEAEKEVEDLVEEIEAAKDKEVEALYRRVEEASD